MNTVWLFIFLFISTATFANPQTLKVVYTDWFPYSYTETGKPLGFEIETVRAVLKRMQKEASFEERPWPKCLEALKTGEADLLVSLLQTPEREAFAFFPATHLSLSRTVFFSPSGTTLSFDGNFEKLAGSQIGVVSGFSYGEDFDKIKTLKKVEVKDVTMLIQMMLNKRLHLGAENEAVIIGTARRMRVDNKIQVSPTPIHENKLFVGFSKAKGHKAFSEAFSNELDAFKKTKDYEKILSKYGIKFSNIN